MESIVAMVQRACSNSMACAGSSIPSRPRIWSASSPHRAQRKQTTSSTHASSSQMHRPCRRKDASSCTQQLAKCSLGMSLADGSDVSRCSGSAAKMRGVALVGPNEQSETQQSAVACQHRTHMQIAVLHALLACQHCTHMTLGRGLSEACPGLADWHRTGTRQSWKSRTGHCSDLVSVCEERCKVRVFLLID
jgi:hypothetical protein